jgi:hypothetical protein
VLVFLGQHAYCFFFLNPGRACHWPIAVTRVLLFKVKSKMYLVCQKLPGLAFAPLVGHQGIWRMVARVLVNRPVGQEV